MPRTFLLLASGFFALLSVASPPPTWIEDGPLHEVIPALYGEPVLPYTGGHKVALGVAVESALAQINATGITSRRVNEVGNQVEAFVVAALREAGFAADRPTARSGRRRAVGYPDLEATRGGDVFYLEIKTYHPRTEDSTQRSFYLSPSDDPKVTQPAHHLAIAFAMMPGADGRYRAESVKILDLYHLKVQLKMEYNAGNDDLYGEQAGLEVFSVEVKSTPAQAE